MEDVLARGGRRNKGKIRKRNTGCTNYQKVQFRYHEYNFSATILFAHFMNNLLPGDDPGKGKHENRTQMSRAADFTRTQLCNQRL